MISRRKEIGMTFNNTAHCTGDFCDIAAPCTRMITYPDMLDYGNAAEYNIATIHFRRCSYVENS